MSCFVQIFPNIPYNPKCQEVKRKHQSLPKPDISRVPRYLSLLSPESLSQCPPPSHCASCCWRVTSLGNDGHNLVWTHYLNKCKHYHKTRNLSIAKIKKCLNVVEKGKRGDQELRGGKLMFLMRSLQISNGI